MMENCFSPLPLHHKTPFIADAPHLGHYPLSRIPLPQHPIQGTSASTPLPFWVGEFLCWGAALFTLGWLAAGL